MATATTSFRHTPREFLNKRGCGRLLRIDRPTAVRTGRLYFLIGSRVWVQQFHIQTSFGLPGVGNNWNDRQLREVAWRGKPEFGLLERETSRQADGACGPRRLRRVLDASSAGQGEATRG